MAGLSPHLLFRFNSNSLCLCPRVLITSSSGTGHRCGSVFKQVKGRKPPNSAFLSSPLSPSERPGGNGLDIRGLCHQALASPQPRLTFCTFGHASPPRQTSPHRWTNPMAPVPFLRLEPLSLCTHPPRLRSDPAPPWGCLLRRLHSTDPDTRTLTQSLARLVLCWFPLTRRL